MSSDTRRLAYPLAKEVLSIRTDLNIGGSFTLSVEVLTNDGRTFSASLTLCNKLVTCTSSATKNTIVTDTVLFPRSGYALTVRHDGTLRLSKIARPLDVGVTFLADVFLAVGPNTHFNVACLTILACLVPAKPPHSSVRCIAITLFSRTLRVIIYHGKIGAQIESGFDVAFHADDYATTFKEDKIAASIIRAELSDQVRQLYKKAFFGIAIKDTLQ